LNLSDTKTATYGPKDSAPGVDFGGVTPAIGGVFKSNPKLGFDTGTFFGIIFPDADHKYVTISAKGAVVAQAIHPDILLVSTQNSATQAPQPQHNIAHFANGHPRMAVKDGGATTTHGGKSSLEICMCFYLTVEFL
jgi:hypothetical protein